MRIQIILVSIFWVFLIFGCAEVEEVFHQDVSYDIPFSDQSPEEEKVDQCTAGERICEPTGQGYQICTRDSYGSYYEWGPIIPCQADEACENGACVEKGCDNACSENSKQCSPDRLGVESCGLDDETGCYEWGEVEPCDGGKVCSGGVCGIPGQCQDECTLGSAQCSGDGFQACENTETGCLDWGQVQACPDSQTCSNGKCGVGCSNECTQGSKKCTTTGYKECGQYDGDTCLEWGAVIPCQEGETCSKGSCKPAAQCSDECESGATQCTPSGDGYQQCADSNGDGCQEWGLVYQCESGKVCRLGSCVVPCSCDMHANICEAAAPGSSTKCACDPDCGTKEACTHDGYCDLWCPAGVDPDCSGCTCNYNEYCETKAYGSTENCACDPDCGLNDYACSDDGHCDLYCPIAPAPVDPDCTECYAVRYNINDCKNKINCKERWMSIGYLFGEELTLYGNYENPDSVEEAPWVLLSPDTMSGSGEAIGTLKFAKELLDCVTGIKVEVAAYDDSFWGTGAYIYALNWDTYAWDLLPVDVDSDFDFYQNFINDVSPYIKCLDKHCRIYTRLSAGPLDNTHVAWVEVYIYLTGGLISK